MKLNFTSGLVLLSIFIFATPVAVLSYRALNSPPEPSTAPTTQIYKQYSDNLLMFRAKRLDPEYKDNPPPVADDSARQALEAMTRAVVQFNADSIQININQGESGSEEKPDSGLPEALEPGP